jgi:DMSO/TMAO reductase YedYZ molybdopterin-dependent catalytic subunit
LTNDLLLVLLLAQVLGGVLGWALAVDAARPLYDVHRALGVSVLVVLGWKQAIALASLRKRVLARGRHRDSSVVWGSLAGLGLLVTVGLGVAWTLNLISFDLLWGYSPLNVHVIVGIAVLPFVGCHMIARRRANKASAPVASRRALVRLGGLSVATLIGWQAIERWAPPVRLASGSKPTASFSGNAFFEEIWLFDSVPVLDGAEWRLRVGSTSFGLSDLADGFPRRDVQAVLDCTSGWWSEQVWSGARLLDVLRAANISNAAREVAITSVTGHRIVLPVADVQDAVLASHVGGEVLSPGHGYPVRLVVPGRRGYQWVKWVAQIDAV